MTVIAIVNRKLVVTFFLGCFTSVIIVIALGIPSMLQNKVLNSESAISQWSKSLPAILSQDQQRITQLMKELKNASIDEIRDHFYMIANMPLQSVCTVGKFFGGQWHQQGCLDGNKYVCLDELYNDILNGKCLIYSFGIFNDWTFEESMAELGCTIRAFDPTIDGSSKPKTDQISFQKIGVKEFSGTAPGLGEVLTLQDAVEKMGDTGKFISYLKVDVEGSELKALSEWISSGILKYVSQFGIEIHTGLQDIPADKIVPQLTNMLDVFRNLHKIGFRLISNTPNDCIAKSYDLHYKYVNLFEVVFYKKRTDVL